MSSDRTTASLTSLTPATSYTYKAYGDSSCSTKTTNATTDARFFAKPAQVTGVTVAPGSTFLKMSWTAASSMVMGYKVQRKTSSQAYETTRQITITTGTSTTVNGLVNGTAYTVRVMATNTTSDGTASVEFTAATPSLLCGHTLEVRNAIVAAVSVKISCSTITNTDLTGITSLSIRYKTSLKALKTGDFISLTALEALYLDNNSLSSLPVGVLDKQTKLEHLYLHNNSRAPREIRNPANRQGRGLTYLSAKALKPLTRTCFCRQSHGSQFGLKRN